MNDNDILSGLTEAQRDAVICCDGAQLVIAGAGSGKTRVLTHKIAYLIDQGFAPWNILALTFTNKAAAEMRERIGRLIGEERARMLWMGTFHSVFLRILRVEHERIGYPANLTIYDESDSRNLLKNIVKGLELDDKFYKPAMLQGRISRAKEQLETAADYQRNGQNYQSDMRAQVPQLGKIYAIYEQRLRTAGAMDFDDILLHTYLLFKNHEDVRRKYVERFAYVLVDEYQDTNFAQHEIVWQLSKERQRLCAVGDDAQSIYSFRGAQIDNILKFQQRYPEMKLFKLEENFRSTKVIVNAANSLIAKNNGQIRKTLYSNAEQGDKITLTEMISDVDESRTIANQLERLRSKERLEYSDFAILYRTNAQSRVFEDEFRKQGIPFRIYGGISFYDRKEIKDAIAYFRVAVNPHDEEALRRIVNYPARAIGNKTVEKLLAAATEQQTSLWNVLAQPQLYGVSLTKKTAASVGEFTAMMADFQQRQQTENAADVGFELLRQSGVIREIFSDTSIEGQARQENIEELVSGLKQFCQQRQEEGRSDMTLTDYISEVSLLSAVETGEGDGQDAVSLMTVHSAKGLEFNTVFIPGLEEDLFPSQMAEGEKAIEEERRLCYVAITRAKRHCFLSHANMRWRYGNMERPNPSRFLSEIDPSLLDKHSHGGKRNAAASADVELPWKSSFSAKASSYGGGGYGGGGFGGRGGYGGRSGYGEGSSARGNGWGRSGSNNGSRSAQQPSAPALPPNMKPVSQVVAKSSGHGASAAQASGLRVGQHIIHERFGRGEILALEGSGDNAKAKVRFQQGGEKQLLLKFARFSVED